MRNNNLYFVLRTSYRLFFRHHYYYRPTINYSTRAYRNKGKTNSLYQVLRIHCSSDKNLEKKRNPASTRISAFLLERLIRCQHYLGAYYFTPVSLTHLFAPFCSLCCCGHRWGSLFELIFSLPNTPSKPKHANVAVQTMESSLCIY